MLKPSDFVVPTLCAPNRIFAVDFGRGAGGKSEIEPTNGGTILYNK